MARIVHSTSQMNMYWDVSGLCIGLTGNEFIKESDARFRQ